MAVTILDSDRWQLTHNHLNVRSPDRAIIPTPRGSKYLIDLAAGDRIYSFDSTWEVMETAVSHVRRSESGRARKIRTLNRRITLADDGCVMIVKVEKTPHPTRPWHMKRTGSFQWMPAERIAVGDLIVCAERYYGDRATIGRGRARLVGAMLGDGWVRHDTARRGYMVGLAIGRAGERHSTRYRALLEAELPTANWSLDAKGAFGLTCSSAAVWRAMAALGLTGYSHEKRVPGWAFPLALDEKRALLAGYMDADGSISANYRNAGRGTIASTNPELVEQLRELAIACGLRITLIGREARQTNFGFATVYRCTLSSDAVQQLDLWHDRKSRRMYGCRTCRSSGLASDKIGYLELPPRLFVQRVSAVNAGIGVAVISSLSLEHQEYSLVCDGIVVRSY